MYIDIRYIIIYVHSCNSYRIELYKMIINIINDVCTTYLFYRDVIIIIFVFYNCFQIC